MQWFWAEYRRSAREMVRGEMVREVMPGRRVDEWAETGPGTRYLRFASLRLGALVHRLETQPEHDGVLLDTYLRGRRSQS
jgi:hypothetical protein